MPLLRAACFIKDANMFMPVFLLPASSSRRAKAAQKRTGFINPAGAMPREFDWVYRDPRWRALIARVRQEVGERRQDEQHDPGKPHAHIELDHIVELQDGGAPFDRSNVMFRCRSCHVRKTARKKADRQAAEWWAKRAREEQGGGRLIFSKSIR
jgi:5-methylcytosine-specific restriction protein A